jgi:hypothetical protein
LLKYNNNNNYYYYLWLRQLNTYTFGGGGDRAAMCPNDSSPLQQTPAFQPCPEQLDVCFGLIRDKEDLENPFHISSPMCVIRQAC